MRSRVKEKGIFIPLTAEAFSWFLRGKCWELRREGGPWNINRLRRSWRNGATISCGYSGPRIIAVDTWNNVVRGSLDEIFRWVPYHEIVPVARDAEEAKELALKILGPSKSYIAFELNPWGHDGMMLHDDFSKSPAPQKHLPKKIVMPRRLERYFAGKRKHARLDLPETVNALAA